MAHRLIVAGIGPGGREYILPRALSAIEGAKYLAGGRRALSDFAKESQYDARIQMKANGN